MLTLMPYPKGKEVDLHGNHLLCETRKQLLAAKGAKPQYWGEIGFALQTALLGSTEFHRYKASRTETKEIFIILHGSGISSVLVLNFELWCSSASLSALRVDRCQPQLHLASDALELEWCSVMSMRRRHRVKKETKRWVSTWDFTVWTELGRRLLTRTHESSMITVQVKQIPPIFFSTFTEVLGVFKISPEPITSGSLLEINTVSIRKKVLPSFYALIVLSHSGWVRDSHHSWYFIKFHCVAFVFQNTCFQIALPYCQAIFWASTIISSRSQSKSFCCSSILLVFCLCLFLWSITLHLSALHFIWHMSGNL